VQHQGRELGEVVIALSRTAYREQVRQQVWTGVVVSIMAVLAGFLSSGLLVRRFLRRPLHELSRIARGYGEGEYATPLVSVRYREFQPFFATLFGMGETIRKQFAALTSANADVETRSADLLQTNTRLAAEIAERKRSQEELARYRDQLEETVRARTDELSTRNLELSRALREAEAANQAKSAFLSNMSHELRTPLNAILGFANLMDMDFRASPVQKQRVGVILKSGEHLLALINDVLDLAKIEAGKVELSLSDFDATALTRDVVEMLRGRAEEKAVRLLLESSSPITAGVHGDAAKTRQILTNLVGNAIKFTSQGQVLVRVSELPVSEAGGPRAHSQSSLSSETGRRICFEVEDTGIGIAPADQQRIFQPFEQIERKDRIEGTGLGLSITQRYVEQLGGTLTLRSELGKGTSFRVELPVGDASSTAGLEGSQRDQRRVVGLAPGQPEFRVLVVEDQFENQALMKALLEQVGFRVQIAASGEEALHCISTFEPQLIWMDFRLPGMDGSETSRRIRSMEKGKNIPIAGLTASVLINPPAHGMADFDEILGKPFQPRDLFEITGRLLGVRYSFETSRPVGGSPPPPFVPPEASALSVLPAALRTELKNAIVQLDVEQIRTVVERITRSDSALGTQLTRCVERFAYTPLLAALETLES
jgi:signal transduction histidine kinase/CheY-like chemotaxis protein